MSRAWFRVMPAKTAEALQRLRSMPERHKKILDQRLAAYRSGKSQPISHEELMRRLRAK